MKLSVIILSLITSLAFCQSNESDLQLKVATGHPMQYYVSLPKTWNASAKWPVVFALEAADKEFKLNAERFVKARADMPFIIVAPINTNNGNRGRRDAKVFPYSAETWNYIDKVGDCQFNADGIRQIMLDIQKQFNGEEKVYMTGFEAGAHDLWSIVFNHPEYLKAAVPVAGNFRNRCVQSSVSNDPSKAGLPVQSFVGEKDPYFGPASQYHSQWLAAKELAVKNGYSNIAETIIPEKEHVPLPEEVMKYFYSLQRK